MGGFDLVWMDKAIFVRADTLRFLSAAGIRTVHYNPDNPIGPRGDPGWRLFRRALSHFDVHVVPREVNIDEYFALGAHNVILMPFAHEPSIHYPPPEEWSDANRPIEVGFIGSPYDDRGNFLTELWRRYDIKLKVRGSLWGGMLDEEERTSIYAGGPVYEDAYRRAIWETKINLAFVTHSNRDPYARRNFEIAACGGFMLSERAEGALAHFAEDREAAYFSDIEECAMKIRRYLGDAESRARLSHAARDRAVSSGYSNDARLANVLEEIESTPRRRGSD